MSGQILNLIHVAQCAQQGTVLVVLAVDHLQYLNIEELWIHFGVGNHYCNIPAHSIARF